MRGEGRSTRPGHAVIAALVLLLGLAACSTTSAVRQPATPLVVDAGRAARLISAYRVSNGLGSVTLDPRLMRVASSYARTMAERDQIGHAIGGSLPKRVAAVGYDWGALAENLAASYSNVDEAMAGWKSSGGHRRNLLNPYATEIGIAAAATPAGSKHRNYWALILAMPERERVAVFRR